MTPSEKDIGDIEQEGADRSNAAATDEQGEGCAPVTLMCNGGADCFNCLPWSATVEATAPARLASAASHARTVCRSRSFGNRGRARPACCGNAVSRRVSISACIAFAANGTPLETLSTRTTSSIIKNYNRINKLIQVL